jgi:hypothetical protein
MKPVLLASVRFRRRAENKRIRRTGACVRFSCRPKARRERGVVIEHKDEVVVTVGSRRSESSRQRGGVWPSILRGASLAVVGAIALFVVVAPAGAVTAQEAITALNAQRAANGLPADITENPAWSRACELHTRYLAGGNVSNPHEEDPSSPLYTPEGQQAARSSVLGAGFTLGGANGWEYAPIHLMQTLGPGLSVTGYADGCLWTWPGYQRPAPPQTALFTYPGDGTQIYYAETAEEWPFVPGDLVDLPMGTRTGPHLFVFAFGGEEGDVKLTSATVVGPEGAVEVRTVDNTTPRVAGFLPPGGIIIPVHPLRSDSDYTAVVTGQRADAVPLTWS